MKKFSLALLAAACMPYAAFASDISPTNDKQTKEPKKTSAIHEVIISASPLEDKSAGINQANSSLSGTELHIKAAGNLGKTIESELGVHNSSFGPGVGRPVIRGLSNVRVKVLENSIDTLDVSASSADHSITVEAMTAKRIEILRGAATLRYGNGAIGGVVNVIDNSIPDEVPEKLTGGIEARHNTANDQDSVTAMLNGGSGHWAWHLNGTYRDSNNMEIEGFNQAEPGADATHGFLDNTDARYHSGTAGLSWVDDRGHIGISFSQLENNYGIPPEDEVVRIDQSETRVTLDGERAVEFSGINLARFNIAYNDYEHIEFEGAEKGTKFRNEAFAGRLELLHDEIAGWAGAVGLQASDRRFAAIGEEAFIPKSDIDQYGIFWVGETNRGDWNYELGLRFDRQEISPQGSRDISHNSHTVSAGAQWAFSDTQTFSVSATRAQRAPTVEELLSNGAHHATESFDLGDRSLKEETSNSLDLGYRYEDDLTFTLNLFYNKFNDYIFKRNTGAVDPNDGLDIFQFDQKDAKFYGFETALEIPLEQHWKARLFSDYVRAKFSSNGDVPRIPPLRVGGTLSYQSSVWDGGITLISVKKQNHPGDLEEKTDSYTRLDAHLNRRIKTAAGNWDLFIKGSNLMDREIRQASSFLRELAPESAASVELGARFTF